jgi:thiosulfate/3-mercaptopyruvate sulfurtransferase
MTEQWLHPELIVKGDWLEANLSDPSLRIFDCTTYLRYEVGTGRPYRVESGRADWEKGHIPRSTYLDLQADFSDSEATTSFMRLSPEDTAAAFARLGVDATSRVILYSRGGPQWATRFWWMLRWIGFDNTAILDGGLESWTSEGRALTTDVSSYPAGELAAKPRPDLFVEKDAMLAAIGNEAVCSLNALTADIHSGENPRYGRPGHIPGSKNVPFSALIDLETKALHPPQTAASAFAAEGATPDKRILNYCGGGIAATLDAFLQHQLGYQDITVYDASMSEWAMDASLPIAIAND